MEINKEKARQLFAQAVAECGYHGDIYCPAEVGAKFLELALRPYGDIDKLMAAASVMSVPVQMALEMGSVELPGAGIEDLRRGLSLYHDWSNERRDALPKD